MKLAINTNAYRDLSYEDAVAEIGRDAPGVSIEASTCREHLYPYLHNFKDMYGLVELPFHNVVALSGGWCDFVRGGNCFVGSMLDYQLALAWELDIPIRLFFSNPTDEPEVNPHNLKEGIWNLAEVVRRWSIDCPRIAIENHGGLTSNPKHIERVVKEARNIVQTNIIGTTLDPANYARCRVDPFEATMALNPSYIFHVHVKGMDSNGKFCAPGRGIMREVWVKIIKYLKDINYAGILTYEYEGDDLENRQKHIVDGLHFLMEQIND